jgi:hypothetical protein
VRALAAADQPRSFRPGGQVDVVCELGSPSAVSILTVGVDRLPPRALGQLEDRSAHGLIERIADREANARLPAIAGEGVRRTADITAHQDLAIQILGRQLRERKTEHREVVLGGVRPRVPRSEDRRQRFAGLIQPAPERVEPVPVLIGASRQLLVRVRTHERRIDVQRDRLRASARIPHPRTRLGSRCPDPVEQLPVDRLEHPMRRRLRRPLAEQALLATAGIHVRDAVAAVSEHHRDGPQYPARIVRRPALPRDPHRPQQRSGQPRPVGHLDQQHRPRVRHQPLAVRRDFYPFKPSRRPHQLGALPGRA